MSNLSGHYTYRPGDNVKIIRAGKLLGVEAIVARVFAGGVVSLAITPTQANDYVRHSFILSPDGTYHTLATPDEIELVGWLKGVI